MTTKRLKIGTAPGMTNAQIVSINPVYLTIKNPGIRPPEKSIVTTKNHAKNLRPPKSFVDFESGYAVSTINTTLIATPSNVRWTDTQTALPKAALLITNAYASVVKPIGQNVTSPDITGTLSENDIANRLTKGRTHNKETNDNITILKNKNIFRSMDSPDLFIISPPS